MLRKKQYPMLLFNWRAHELRPGPDLPKPDPGGQCLLSDAIGPRDEAMTDRELTTAITAGFYQLSTLHEGQPRSNQAGDPASGYGPNNGGIP
ncbi:MAG: hypothetical protein H6568_08190 [Lewinellaceae bacterium]|nr:hypothetical protein [Saprospiraceae bacterium]MCB9312734.1 hypothetical protein [Lewinellaceae bacterium]